ncbi:MAG: tyrosine-type recombinase/integrase [Syntrophaceae bacterium]|nr:tyrosine-type recombinase/integrase [Syntrophaceae bacterium]
MMENRLNNITGRTKNRPGKEGEKMGCIYRRGKTLWIKYYRHGRQYAESTGSDKMEIAKRMLKIREGEISEGKMPGVCFDRVSIDDLMDDYLTDYRINRKKTIPRAERCVKFILNEFKGMRAPEVNTAVIKRYIDERLHQGVVNATINRELAALKRAFNLGARCTPPKVAQVPYIPMLKENNIRKGFIEHADYLALRDVLPDYLKPVLMFGYYTGWRRGEILGLKWSHIDLREGTVRLEPGETKNNEGRTLYLEPELWEMLKGLHKERRMDCFYVFHRNGKQIGECRKAWVKACATIGKPGLLFHDLRRSAIRNMVRAGIPERVTMAVSGHKTRCVFDRYNIVSQEDLKEAARKRHEFSEKQSGQLQNSYNRPIPIKKAAALKSATY